MNSAVRNIAIDPVVTSDDFRGAMRHLTGGVSVITAGRGKDISGMTVTSVSEWRWGAITWPGGVSAR